MSSYYAIVLGTGGVGSAAMYHLAKRGYRVLGLDRFPPGHDRGSSHGRSRIIRQAYFEHPDYVPLLLRAYELWHELAQACGKQLYHEIGLLQIGPPDGQVVPRVLGSARRHGLQVDHLTATEAQGLFPAFRIAPLWEAAYEPHAGYLDVEDCVLAHVQEAERSGAELRTGVTVHDWQTADYGVTVDTDAGRFQAAKLVITAGAWSGPFLGDLEIPFEVRRKTVFWYPALDESLRADRGCPAYLFENDLGIFYGIPQVDDWGVKFAQHTGGESVEDPLTVNRNICDAEAETTALFARTFLPQIGRRHLHASVCLYTMSPDENFIVDIHPRCRDVVFAAGLSGHGFKFTCVLGEILADLAIEGQTAHRFGFLNCRRFG